MALATSCLAVRGAWADVTPMIRGQVHRDSSGAPSGQGRPAKQTWVRCSTCACLQDRQAREPHERKRRCTLVIRASASAYQRAVSRSLNPQATPPAPPPDRCPPSPDSIAFSLSSSCGVHHARHPQPCRVMSTLTPPDGDHLCSRRPDDTSCVHRGCFWPCAMQLSSLSSPSLAPKRRPVSSSTSPSDGRAHRPGGTA